MPTPALLSLDDAGCENSAITGGKAATLARLKRRSFPVPPGFAITEQTLRAVSNDSMSTSGLLKKAFEDLLAGNPTASAIVRSSATLEDHPDHLFPGVFESVTGVRTWRDLMEALKRCYASVRTDACVQYCDIHHVELTSIRMAALVQLEVDTDTSGAAATARITDPVSEASPVLIEESPGSSQAMLQGGPVANAFVVERGIITKIEGETQYNTSHAEAPYLVEVARLCRRASDALGYAAEIEWGNSNGYVSLLQARPLPSLTESHRKRYKPNANYEHDLLLAREEELGLKAAAMLFFQQLGLFTKPLLILNPHSDATSFSQDLLSTDFGNDGITVRFSCGHNLGLPRLFVRNAHDALEAIRHYRDPRWTTIVHGYILVRHSFELHIEDDLAIVEHIPGVWESDNSEEPDVLIFAAGRVTGYLMPITRGAKYITPEGEVKGSYSPVEIEVIRKWKDKLSPTLSVLRREFRTHLPLNIHFVSDDLHDWQFLNIRRSHRFGAPSSIHCGFHPVRGIADMETWDHKQPILVRMRVNRGDEEKLIELARVLPPTVYSEFGWLSHPAMVLRERGIKVIPTYLTQRKVQL